MGPAWRLQASGGLGSIEPRSGRSPLRIDVLGEPRRTMMVGISKVYGASSERKSFTGMGKVAGRVVVRPSRLSNGLRITRAYGSGPDGVGCFANQGPPSTRRDSSSPTTGVTPPGAFSATLPCKQGRDSRRPEMPMAKGFVRRGR
jgi:hypothetical protein